MGNTSATLRKKATERWAGINGIERIDLVNMFLGHVKSQLDREQSLGSALEESVLKSLSAVSAQCDSLRVVVCEPSAGHAQLYTREQQRRVGVLIAAGALIPLGLMLLKGDMLFILVAVIFLLAQSWLIRFVYVKISHHSPLEARSA